MDFDDPLADLLKGLDEIESNEGDESENEEMPEPEVPKPEESTLESVEPMDLEPSPPPKFENPEPKAIPINRRPSFVKTQREKMKKRRSSYFLTEKKWLDAVAGINVTDRKISAEVMLERLKSFELLTLHQLSIKGKSKTLPGVWAFYAIVGLKSERQSSKGNKYVSIKLTNFKESISLLAFSAKLRKQLAKLEEGAFICVANPTVLDSNEKFKGIALVLDNENQLIEVGKAKDFDFCASKTKNGRCNTTVNTRHGKYCQFHVKQNYQKVACRRGDVNRSLVKRPSFGRAIKDMSGGDYKFKGDELSTTKKARIKQNCKSISKRAKKGASRRSITIAQAGLTPDAQNSPMALPKLGQGLNFNASFEVNAKGKGKRQLTPAPFQMPCPKPRRVTKTIRKKPPLPTAKQKGSGMAVPMRKRRKANVFEFDERDANSGRRRRPTPIPSAEIMNMPLNLRNPGRTDSPILVQHIEPNKGKK